jgi:hypothetical protein
MSALPDLNGLFLALVLIISAKSLPLILSRLRAHLCKVIRAPAFQTSIIIVRASGLLKIRPRTSLLLLRWSIMSLLRWYESSLLLLWRPNDPTPWLRGLLRGCSWSILHNAILRCRGTRGSSRCLVLLFNMMGRNEILLSDGQI